MSIYRIISDYLADTEHSKEVLSVYMNRRKHLFIECRDTISESLYKDKSDDWLLVYTVRNTKLVSLSSFVRTADDFASFRKLLLEYSWSIKRLVLLEAPKIEDEYLRGSVTDFVRKICLSDFIPIPDWCSE